MTQTQHTAGPFEVQNPMGSDQGLWIVQAGLEAHEWSCIAIVPRDEDRSGKHFITKAEQKANANLFSAAPELLAAAIAQEELMRAPGDPTENIRRVIKMRRAAISKATGAS